MRNGGDGGAPAAGMGALLRRACEVTALAGGALLLCAMLFVSANVVSAAVFAAPVLGDSEVVELLGAVAIAAFLPYCHFERANVIIELVERLVAARTTALLDFAAGVLFSVVAAVVLWRLIAGGIDAHMADDATMFLRIPLSIGYAGAILPCMLWVVVALYVNVVQWRRVAGAV